MERITRTAGVTAIGMKPLSASCSIALINLKPNTIVRWLSDVGIQR
jgi:hypothetical protein